MTSVHIRRFITENATALSLSIILFAAIAIQSSLLYVQSNHAMHQQLDDRLRTAAGLAAREFTGEEIDRITGMASFHTPLYKEFVERLQDIRSTIPDIKYAYIMRRTNDPMMLEFVADADSFEENEESSYPGDFYEINEVHALQDVAFLKPTVDEEITVDQWGELISGYAPIYREDGTVAGVIGIDMDARAFLELSRQAFSGYALIAMFLIAIILLFTIVYIIWERRAAAKRVLENERSALLALATHQLGGPVSSIRWWVEMMKEEGMCDPESACSNIEKAAERINGIVQELIDVERKEHNRVRYQRKECMLSDVLYMAIDSVLPELKAKHPVRTDVDDALKVSIDAELITSAVSELIQNAMMYSDKGEEVVLSARRAGRWLNITVQDHGMGIDKRDIIRIFKK